LTAEIKEDITMKQITAVILTIIAFFTGATAEKPTATAETTEKTFSWVEAYDRMADDLELFKVYNSADLIAERLENRNGDLIIEKLYGVVIDAEGNGRVLMTDEDIIKAHNRDYNSIAEYNYYISYEGTARAKKGDIVLSYFIYNPDSNYSDDIIARFDYIVDNVED
jgi:hypothetical protein